MAVFEHKTSSKITLDDTIPLKCCIESAQTIDGHTEYLCKVTRGTGKDASWNVTRRYNDFASMDAVIRVSGYELPLPPKKLLGNMGREFIAERQQALQVYIDSVLIHPLLACHESVKKFLDPENYGHNIQEEALQQISMFFRSEIDWEVVEGWHDVGCRLRKRYFLIKNKREPKEKLLLSWCSFGPDQYMTDKDLQGLMRLLPTFHHPHLFPVIFASSNEKSAITIRRCVETGTLRDVICKAKVKGCYLNKYCNPRQISVCTHQEVQIYGRQILDTLAFLHEKGIPYGHLHCGNIVVEDNKILLLDIENGLLGQPSIYRPYTTQCKKIKTLEAVDVYCFGQTLYEMTFGCPLNAVTCDSLPSECSQHLESLLKSILGSEATKSQLPSIAELIQHPFFAGSIPVYEKPSVKIPSKLKEVLKQTRTSIIERLRDNQKLIHQYQRLSRAQAYHMSDEEKKKRRKKKRSSMQFETMNQNGSGSELLSPSANLSPQRSPVLSRSGDSSATVSPATSNSPSPVPPHPPTPPPVRGAPPPPPPPPPPPSISVTSSAGGGDASVQRGALLSSISSFSKTGLKKSQTVDKSQPKV